MPVSTQRGSLHQVSALLREERGEMWVVCAYATLAGLMSLALPLGVQAIIGLVSGGMLLQPVVILIAAVIVGTAAAGFVQLLQLGAVERIQQRIFARLALDWGARLPELRQEVAVREHLPETVTRFFEIVIIQKSLSKLLLEAFGAALAIVFGLLLLTMYHPILSLSGAALLGMLGGTLWLTGREALTSNYEESSAKYRVAHWLQEIARRFSLLRAAGPSTMPLQRTDADVADYLRARQSHFRVLVRQSLVGVLFRTVITGALLILGTMLVVQRKITLGQFVASELVVVSILAGVEKLMLNLSVVYDLLTAVEKASHVGALERETRFADTLLPPPDAAGTLVEANELRYTYPGTTRPAIDAVTLTVHPGEHIALTGPEGAGTSTMLAALAGLLPDYEGALAFDNVSARDADPASLRQRIGMVDSAPALIDGTVAENVALGRAVVGERDMLWAIETAGLTSFVRRLPDGLYTRVGGGVELPLETVRRFALARAIATRPSLLLIDSFFHHLAPAFKRELLAQLFRAEHGWTIIGASHDPLFLAACNRIVLVEGGRLVREGPPATMFADPAFASLMHVADDQFITASPAP